jgi:hypothetical protein
MNNRMILLTSIGISVFILAVVAGIVSAIAMNSQNTSNVVQAQAAVPAQAASQDVVQQMATREAAYNELVAQANQRIQTLNNQVAALEAATAASEQQPTLTSEKAAEIALKTVGDDESLQKIPDLVSYQGKEAYEVDLKDGVLYIDSKTGEILFNGVPPRINEVQAGQIAGKYLGGMNPKYAVIKKTDLNGTTVYRVDFNGYVVFVDITGRVVKAQIIQYNVSSGGGGGGSAPAPSTGGGESEHESGHDD